MSHSDSVDYCGKLFKEYMKTHASEDNSSNGQQQPQSQQPQSMKAASSSFNNGNWNDLRPAIVKGF
jgi:hypothetical protein